MVFFFSFPIACSSECGVPNLGEQQFFFLWKQKLVNSFLIIIKVLFRQLEHNPQSSYAELLCIVNCQILGCSIYSLERIRLKDIEANSANLARQIHTQIHSYVN